MNLKRTLKRIFNPSSQELRHVFPSWYSRCDTAKRFGFTSKDRMDARGWRTCAIGERAEIIEQLDLGNKRTYSGLDHETEQSRELYHLGCKFSRVVDEDSPKRAIQILRQMDAIICDREREVKMQTSS